MELLVAGAPSVPQVSQVIDRLALEAGVAMGTADAMRALDEELGLDALLAD